MKYLAILKDSLREALDSKVLYVLLALTTLGILFFASCSFKSESAEKTMQYFFSTRHFEPPMMAQVLNLRKPERLFSQNPYWVGFGLDKVEALRGEMDLPDSDYVLTVTGPPPRAGAGGNDPDAEKKSIQAVRKLFEDADALHFIKLGDVELIPPNDANNARQYYRVTLHGTPRTYRIWATVPALLFGFYPIEFLEKPLCVLIYQLASILIKYGSWVAVLMGVIITSFFIPNMVRKGTIDLLLVKPLQRWVLLSYKFLGGLTFVFLINSYAMVGIWFVFGLRSGLWANGTLLLIFTLTFFFAILYAVSTFVGVVTRSVVTAILLTIGAWFIFMVIGLAYSGFDMVDRMEKASVQFGKAVPEEERWGDGKTAMVVRTIHAITPRTEDLNNLNDLIVFTDFMTGNFTDMKQFDTSNRNWWESLLVSAIWIGIFLGLAAAWFTYKDY